MANQKLSFVQKYAINTSAGAADSMAFTPNANQLIEANDETLGFLAVVGKDRKTVIQTEDKSFLIGSSMGPHTWTSTALAVHAEEPEVLAASDTADEVWVISNFNNGTDKPGIWQFVPEQADASNGGNVQKWIIKDFKILPLHTTAGNTNPHSAVVIDGDIYMTGPSADSGAARDLKPYDFTTNAFSASVLTFGDGIGNVVDMAFDGVYLYAMLTGASASYPQVIEKYKWNSSSDITLVQRFALQDVPQLPSDLTAMRGMTVADNQIYISDNTNVAATAFVYVLNQPATTGLDDRIRLSMPLRTDLSMDKGVQFEGQGSADNAFTGTIDFSSGKAAFDTTQRLDIPEINRGLNVAFGSSNDFSLAVTVRPASVINGMAVCAFLAGSTEKLIVNGTQWQYNIGGSNIVGTSAGPEAGKEQRLVVTYDSATETVSLFADGVSIATPKVITRDVDAITSMAIGCGNFSGPVGDGFDGEESDFVIYNFVVDPTNEPSRIPVFPNQSLGGRFGKYTSYVLS